MFYVRLFLFVVCCLLFVVCCLLFVVFVFVFGYGIITGVNLVVLKPGNVTFMVCLWAFHFINVTFMVCLCTSDSINVTYYFGFSIKKKSFRGMQRELVQLVAAAAASAASAAAVLVFTLCCVHYLRFVWYYFCFALFRFPFLLFRFSALPFYHFRSFPGTTTIRPVNIQRCSLPAGCHRMGAPAPVAILAQAGRLEPSSSAVSNPWNHRDACCGAGENVVGRRRARDPR